MYFCPSMKDIRDVKEAVQQKAENIYDELLEVRRHLHSNPELSYEEFKTSEYVCEFLRKEGIPFKHGWVKTGITAEIQGNGPGKRIALRADMDALPITEKTNLPFTSKNKGVMHACGHDVHTSCLLGAAKILNSLKNSFSGTIQLIFQPGEERLPGGASLMLKEGIFKKSKPEAVIGQHVYPQLRAGQVGFKPGMYMASADELHVTVKGKGGHAALPHNLVDPILISAHMITALQQVISRNKNTLTPGILSFGYISGEGATNVIPNEVKIKGTFRTMDEEFRTEAHEKMTRIAKGVVEGLGGEVDFKIDKGYPCVYNDEEVTARCMSYAKDYLGENNVKLLDLRMTAEDFAYYTQTAPGCFYRLGTAFPDRENPGLHHPEFNVNEESLKTGIGLMAYITIKQLQQ